MNEHVYRSALAGLLHDIGKVAVRAGERGSRIWDDEARRDFGYFHALLTADFVDRCAPEPWRAQVKNLAGNHHRPNSRQEQVIALADHLSAGERADPTDAADPRAAQPQQLLSIFCSLRADDQDAPQPLYLPLAPLRIDADVLRPGAQQKDDEQTRRAYAALWDAFRREAEDLRDAHRQAPDLPAFLESLLLLMQRYLWCAPSAYYRARPDVSLFDHLRMTAALAAVLAESDLSDARWEALARAPQDADDEVCLLVGGDVSGVQEFIYRITARGATSALRGRSFYLQLLAEAIARYILRELDLPIVNLVYAGGGNFYLLARPGDRQRLTTLGGAISRTLWGQHQGSLYLALRAVPLQARDFFAGRIGPAWERLLDELQRAKQQRFAELGADLSALFAPQGSGGNEEQQCQVCGAEHSATRVIREDSDEEGVRKCPPCLAYEELGKRLRQARYLVLEEIEPAPAVAISAAEPGGWEEALAAFGMRVDVREALQAQELAEMGRRLVLALDDEALEKARAARLLRVGRRFLVNATPVITEREIVKLRREGMRGLPAAGSVKPFEALEAQAEGIPRLGVLLMDVDDAGRLFSTGLGQQATLSRVATLSFALSLFFEGWVGRLAEELNRQDERGERLYSIYSGGDDLFFVGAWDAVVELARRVRADLTWYAAGHPGIHASAGIALVGGKYPLAQAALDAREAERQAKGVRRRSNGRVRRKDAVCFLRTALPWERFGLEECAQVGMDTAHALMHWLKGLVGEPGQRDASASRALLQHLIVFHERYRAAAQARREAGLDRNRLGEEQGLWGPWMWQSFYQLSRMADQRKGQPQVQAEIERLRDRLKVDGFRSIEWIGLAARWAELALRRGR